MGTTSGCWNSTLRTSNAASQEMSEACVQFLKLLLILNHTHRTFNILDEQIFTDMGNHINNWQQKYHIVACGRWDGSSAPIWRIWEWHAGLAINDRRTRSASLLMSTQMAVAIVGMCCCQLVEGATIRIQHQLIKAIDWRQPRRGRRGWRQGAVATDEASTMATPFIWFQFETVAMVNSPSCTSTHQKVLHFTSLYPCLLE